MDIDGKTLYVVGLANPGEGIPSPNKLRDIALTAETIAPFNQPLSLETNCTYIHDSVHSGAWATPFLIPEQLLEITTQTNAFDEGLTDTASGLFYNANPHVHCSREANEWDDRWLKGRRGNLEDLKHYISVEMSAPSITP